MLRAEQQSVPGGASERLRLSRGAVADTPPVARCTRLLDIAALRITTTRSMANAECESAECFEEVKEASSSKSSRE